MSGPARTILRKQKARARKALRAALRDRWKAEMKDLFRQVGRPLTAAEIEECRRRVIPTR